MATTCQVDAARFWDVFTHLRQIGLTDQGLKRVAWTDSEWEAKEWLKHYLQQSGFNAYIDGAGNVLGVWEPHPGRPFVMLGSHVDTVPEGGAYDGALGVVGAIEALTVIREHPEKSRYNVAVALFTDEEGVKLGDGLFGSQALIGQWSVKALERLETSDGHGVNDLAKPYGRSVTSILDAIWPFPLIAYLELHVEQGPVLDKLGVPIGVVSTIVGRRQGRVSVKGKTNHAGTTPMADRQDALVAASRSIVALQELASEYHMVGTVGSIRVQPDVANIIPGRAEFTYDIRGVDDDRLTQIENEWISRSPNQGLFTVGYQFRHPPVSMDRRLQELILKSAQDLGLPAIILPSWAVHDALVMAAVAPTAMIFVPSRRGISHARDEFTPEERCLDGVKVLTRVLESVVAFGIEQTQSG